MRILSKNVVSILNGHPICLFKTIASLMKLLTRVDPWTTHGLGAPPSCAVENPSVTTVVLAECSCAQSVSTTWSRESGATSSKAWSCPPWRAGTSPPRQSGSGAIYDEKVVLFLGHPLITVLNN